MNSQPFVYHNISQYNPPDNNDTCVALCYFNPLNYKNPKENLDIVLQTLKNSNIPYYTIELLYPNQEPSIKDATKIVRANTVNFSKENLWNLLEKDIPDKYSKIIFIDADIKFSNPNWFNLSSRKLEACHVIQPMDVVYRDLVDKYKEYVIIDNQECKYSVAHAITKKGTACPMKNHPGFAIGINRDFLHKINGFFEYGLLGSGDTLFWSAISNYYASVAERFLIKRNDIGIKYYEYKLNIFKQIPHIRIGVVFDNLSVHLYHGKLSNRKYCERETYLSDDGYNNFFTNEYGVIEIIGEDNMIQYWKDRKEDD